MSGIIKKASMYLLVAIITNAVFAFVLYFLFTWLAEHSLFYAYLGNLIFIILALAIDEYTQNLMQSETLVVLMKKEKDQDKFYRSLQRGLSSVGSFKSDLYLFYIIILVLSKAIEFYPSLVSEGIGDFIRANDYSILLLVAFDTLIAQIIKDREKMKNALAKVKNSMIDNQNNLN